MITQNQQFDTIRLHIPEEAISNVDLELFSIPTSYNAFTQKEIWKGEKQLHLINTGKGINYVKHVPKFKLYDIQISAKILREDYYKGMNLEKLNPIFDPIAQEITSLLMHNKTNEQRLVKLINQYWGLQNRSTKFDSIFMRELNLRLKQVAQTDRLQLRKFLLILRMNFQTKPKPGKPSMFPGV
jgi:hypothetical protein